MRSILQALFDGTREDLGGYPASLIRLLRARPDTRVEVHGYRARIYQDARQAQSFRAGKESAAANGGHSLLETRAIWHA